MKPIVDIFVLVAADCPVAAATVPAPKGGRDTVAVVQFELLAERPYGLTLEDLIFATHTRRSGLGSVSPEQDAEIRAALFAKPHPCMRASPLPKNYGWGVHHDAAGRMALYGVGTAEYRRFASGAGGVQVVPAMRNKRAG